MTPTEIARMIDREEFAASSAAFRARAMATLKHPRPKSGGNPSKTIERPKTDRALRGLLFTVDGLRLTRLEWCKHLHTAYITLSRETHRLGSVEAAIRHIASIKAKQAGGYDQTSPYSQGTGVGSRALERGNSENSHATENGRISA